MEMKPTRKKRKLQKQSGTEKDAVQVFCRLRPTRDHEKICVKVISPSVISVEPPEGSVHYRGNANKETQYMFKHIFVADVPQKEVFNTSALPIVESFLKGKNGLLFAYGITGSGKTYTMTGDSQNPGIMPRSIHAIFNTIKDIQTPRFLVKPDKLNGFDLQSEEDAAHERVLNAKTLESCKKTPAPKTPRQKGITKSASLSSLELSGEEIKITDIDEDSLYSVFVTYVEIYNNGVYDLLEDTEQKCLQIKIIREDSLHNMYVHGVVEVEVKSAAEAFEVYNSGLKRKRIAHTKLNAESSRSHSVFSLRLVQCPLDRIGEQIIHDKDCIIVSQLSLVDLAGSERAHRTQITGVRLKEASSINNSLLSLRTCLEILRENQMTDSNVLVPYRQSKLTHLFKNYFEGEGSVRVIVCVNPRFEDFDESLHVLKFAEMTQDIQIAQPTPVRMDPTLVKGRRKLNMLVKDSINELSEKAHQEIDPGLVYNLGLLPKPDVNLQSPEADIVIKNIILYLEMRVKKRKELLMDFNIRSAKFRELLVQNDKNYLEIKTENSGLKAVLSQAKNKISHLEAKLTHYESSLQNANAEIETKQEEINTLKCKLKEQQTLNNKIKLEKDKQKQTYEKTIFSQHENFQKKAQLLTDKYLKISSSENVQPATEKKENELKGKYLEVAQSRRPQIGSVRKEANGNYESKSLRKRRSRSVGHPGERWIEHRSGLYTSLGTVLQPCIQRQKSVTKLVDAKDITESKASKYCLITQENDTDGEIQTKIYKGDVLPTQGGGAEVVFSGVETLQYHTPTECFLPGGSRKRSSSENPNFDCAKRCSTGIEGHKY